MDRILFGDNQFFGVNHMSEEKARAMSMRFRDSQSMIKVLDKAYEMGIHTFMCTTHDSISEICTHIRSNPNRYDKFKFYPGMPYAHKYANAVTELGIMEAMKKFIPGSIFGTLFQGGLALAKKDYVSMMKMMIDAEMKMFEGLNVEVIFMQNVLTDLLLGLGFLDIFKAYSEYIRSRYHAEPGFITMNLPKLLDMLEQCEISNPIVCASINKIGFRMCGGIQEYENTIRDRKFRPIAMSIFASGAIPAHEAVEYICRQNIQSIVFGASSESHIRQTKEMIDQYWHLQ